MTLHRNLRGELQGPSNINKKEMIALKELKNNKDLIIRAADKGGAVVILNAQLYNKLNMEILSDTTTYQPLSEDPTKEYFEGTSGERCLFRCLQRESGRITICPPSSGPFVSFPT